MGHPHDPFAATPVVVEAVYKLQDRPDMVDISILAAADETTATTMIVEKYRRSKTGMIFLPSRETKRFVRRLQFALVVALLAVTTLVFNSFVEGARRTAVRRKRHRHHDLVEVKESTPPSTTTTTTTNTNTGWVRPPVVYGLLHVTETSGTDINGELANHFERVCGDHGYSYDAVKTNQRFRQQLQNNEEGGVTSNAVLQGDTVSAYFGHNNRGSPPRKWMNEIGYEDCDFIAMETHARTWANLASELSSSSSPLEIHVPCREPLDHIMAQCHHYHHTFDCGAEDLEAELLQCQKDLHGRFKHYLERTPDLSPKCFDALAPAKYIHYMGSILQPRRVQVNYFPRDVSHTQERQKDKECIWQQPQDVQDQVRQKIVELFPYYQFCDSCMGSELELPLNHN